MMVSIKKFFHVLFLMNLCWQCHAETAKAKLYAVHASPYSKTHLQRGAKLYMNYCSGCHSLKYLRYSTMAKGLGLTTFDGQIDKPLLQDNLIFTTLPVHSPIEIAMSEEDAVQWFGIKPPDLSLIARARGTAWIYTYLKSFYADNTRPFGSNNMLVPDVAMPNVLLSLQGTQVKKDTKDGARMILTEHGIMSAQEFDSALTDLVSFLEFVSEPKKSIRESIGIWVIAFLMVLAVFAYFLKKSYWKNIR